MFQYQAVGPKYFYLYKNPSHKTILNELFLPQERTQEIFLRFSVIIRAARMPPEDCKMLNA